MCIRDRVDITASAKNIKKALKSCSHIENYAVIVHFLAKHLKPVSYTHLSAVATETTDESFALLANALILDE